MNLTRVINKVAFKRRYRQIQRYATLARSLQEDQLNWLLEHAQHTVFGQEHGFTPILEWQQEADPGRRLSIVRKFQQAVPLQTYDEQKPYIERMLQGEKNILWPGRCRHFAKSSGTTSDKSKFIPVTGDALKYTHFRGGTDSVVIYMALNPKSHMFSGKGLVLGGSFDPRWTSSLEAGKPWDQTLRVGDLSATLIDRIPALGEFIRVPKKEVALMTEWEAKMQAITHASMKEDVTNLSGVPSWMMGVLKNVLKETGKKDLSEVWPNLEVFFHGGIAFPPYREEYRKLIPSDKMHYLETYNASEGFFGIQSSWDDHAMQLIIDNRIFYEFIPMDEFDLPDAPGDQLFPIPGQHRHAVPLWEVEIGRNYAMVISTPGLWRYIIGDTVKFTQKDPYKFFITGRTKAFINAFGEELMVSNADEALTLTCQELGAQIADYTAAPVFAEGNRKGRHHWVIEFTQTPADLEAFADLLDQNLQRVNSDYEAKRYKGIFLDRLSLTAAPAGTFNRWLQQRKGKLGGQIKIPRLSNNDSYIKELQNIIP